MAAVALTQFAGVEVAAFVVSAVGADKAVWPAPFEPCFEALVFVTVML